MTKQAVAVTVGDVGKEAGELASATQKAARFSVAEKGTSAAIVEPISDLREAVEGKQAIIAAAGSPALATF